MSRSTSLSIFECLEALFNTKSFILKEYGWYKTLSGKWCDGHGRVMTKKEAYDYIFEEKVTVTK